MDKELFCKLASKMGITSVKVLSQAEEYIRLAQVKCTGLGSATATSKAIICLELAATSMRFPLDKEFAIKLSGLNKKSYQSSLKSLECMLGLQSSVGLGDLAVRYGCVDAVNVASRILQRYEASLPAAQQQGLDFSKPLFTTAALFTACSFGKLAVSRPVVLGSWDIQMLRICCTISKCIYGCMKIRVDKKLAASSGTKKAVFDRLCTQLLKFGQEIYSETSSMKVPVRMAQKRQNALTEAPQEMEADNGLLKSPKQQKVEQLGGEESVDNAKQNYEEWKRKILENALREEAVDS